MQAVVVLRPNAGMPAGNVKLARILAALRPGLPAVEERRRIVAVPVGRLPFEDEVVELVRLRSDLAPQRVARREEAL